MPYHLMKYPTGYKVMDDKGREYSKKPLPKQRAIAQMRALYANTTVRGKGYTSYEMNGNHHLVLHGNGRFTEFIKKGVRKVGEIAKRAVAPALRAFNVVAQKGIRDDLPPAARATLAQYGNCLIKSIMVRREPIKSWIHTALDYISLGQWNKVRNRLNYDKLYHLSLVAGIQCANGTKKGIMMEKNEVINITDKYDDGSSRAGAGTDMEYFNVPVPTPIPLKQFVDKAIEAVGPSIYQYDAFSNNCQVFIVSLLRANNLISPQIQAWILQPTESLLAELPDFVAPAARSITNIAALADRVIEGRGAVTDVTDLRGAGFFDDVGSWFKTTFTGQRDEYPTQPLYDIDAEVGPPPSRTALDAYISRRQKEEFGKARSAKFAVNLEKQNDPEIRRIENSKANRYEKARKKLYDKGLSTVQVDAELRKLGDSAPYYQNFMTKQEYCKYDTANREARGEGPSYECDLNPGLAKKDVSVSSYLDPSKTKDALICEWLKTPEGAAWKATAEQYNANRDAYAEANREIQANNAIIEAENRKIRDCNESFGCALKTAFTNITDVVSWIPGPIGTVAGAVNTGLSFFGDGKPDLSKERYLDLKGFKPMTKEEYKKIFPRNPPEAYQFYEKQIDDEYQSWKKTQEAGVSEQETQEKKKALASKIKLKPGETLTDDDVKFQGELKATNRTKEENQAIFKSRLKVGQALARPAQEAKQAKTFTDTGKVYIPNCATVGSGKKRCCGGCEKENDGSCSMRGGCGSCGGFSGGSNGVFIIRRRKVKGGAKPVVMDRADYLAEHKRLINLLDDIKAKVSKEARTQKAEPELKGGKLPFSKAEYLKRVKARAASAGYDSKKIAFSDKPAKKFMITDEAGKKHYFGATSYGDHHIWSAIDKETGEKKRAAYLARATKIKGNWKDDKYSPNNLAIKILW